ITHRLVLDHCFLWKGATKRGVIKRASDVDKTVPVPDHWKGAPLSRRFVVLSGRDTCHSSPSVYRSWFPKKWHDSIGNGGSHVRRPRQYRSKLPRKYLDV